LVLYLEWLLLLLLLLLLARRPLLPVLVAVALQLPHALGLATAQMEPSTAAKWVGTW